MRGTTVITGAGGYLGTRIAAALLVEGDDDLVLTLRARDRAELADRRERLLRTLGGDAVTRTRVLAVDVRAERPLDGLDPRRITRIVHTAAVTRFNVDRRLARAVNVAGTARLRDFALRCERLHSLALLSTLYAAGRHEGDVKEERLGDAGFVNHYEWSKWAAEEELMEEAGRLPVTVLRLPTVVAEDASGTVVQHNAFHNTLKLYYYGLLSLLPGDLAAPLPLATADFVVPAVTALLAPRVPGGVYHVCADPAQTAPMGALVDRVFTVFERDASYRRRGLLRPVPCDAHSFRDLVGVASRMRGGPIHQSLESVAPFAEQLCLPKTFHNQALRDAWPQYAAPDPATLAEAVCDRLIASQWGRCPEETP